MQQESTGTTALAVIYKVPDPPRDGINTWLMTAARSVRTQGGKPIDARETIRAFENGLRRPLKKGEVDRAIRKVWQTEIDDDGNVTAADGTVTTLSQTKEEWRPIMSTAASKCYGYTEEDLLELSPVNPLTMATEEIVGSLFPDPHGLVCVGVNMSEFGTAPVALFSHLKNAAFIVPHYMSAKYGRRQSDGELSQHTLENTGPVRYCVTDFDSPPSDQHASIIHSMAQSNALVLVLNSGNKSLHAWWNVPEFYQDTFWKQAIRCGADPVFARNRAQFARMPNGMRDNGVKQQVIYFDPEKLPL